MKVYRQTLIDQGLSVKRINFYTTFASGIFNHEMKTTGYLKLNPTGGLQLREMRRRDEMRDGFTLDQLKALFVNSPAYSEDTHNRADRFWIPLLGLFTGARLEEICQLYVDQVRKDDGVWSLIMDQEHEEQSIKTSERRVVPIHPFLVEDLGFVIILKRVCALRVNRCGAQCPPAL